MHDIRRCFTADLLAGEVAVVTGGGSGLGYAIAEAFAAVGADVVLASRSADRLDAAESRIAAATGRLCRSFPCDIRDEDDVERLRDFVDHTYGPPTVVVNNAAANFGVRAERLTGRALASVIDTDLFGTLSVTRAFVPRMIRARRGVILNITLASPERGFPGFSHCGAAKAAIVSLTASWAAEWGRHGIRVNGIAPGPVPTEGVAVNMMGLSDGADAFADQRSRIPLQRLGEPADVAAMAVFLCSPAASWITGQNLIVDGGLSLNTSPLDG
jgi:NAD(P)-dependent dehydrogenase (short-subunit alcohol dehydrogenase family)